MGHMGVTQMGEFIEKQVELRAMFNHWIVGAHYFEKNP